MASKFIHIKNDTNQENEDSLRCPWEMFRCNYWSSIVKIKLYKLIISTLCDKDKHVTMLFCLCCWRYSCAFWLLCTMFMIAHHHPWLPPLLLRILHHFWNIQNGTVYIKNMTNSINNVAIIAFQSSMLFYLI